MFSSSALKMKKFSRFELSESKGIKSVLSKVLLSYMYLAYMKPKQRGRTHILCLLTVFLVN